MAIEEEKGKVNEMARGEKRIGTLKALKARIPSKRDSREGQHGFKARVNTRAASTQINHGIARRSR